MINYRCSYHINYYLLLCICLFALLDVTPEKSTRID